MRNFVQGYTTPSDPTKCRYFNPNGPTPCHHPHCDCPMPKPDWNRPDGCHCITTGARDRCYERCEPKRWDDDDAFMGKDVETSKGSAALALCAVAFIVMLIWFAGMKPAHSADAAPPRYCAVFHMLDRSCTAARLVVKMYGKVEAERRARVCGATDSDISQAQKCLADKGE
jgi:hypothetical protein